MAPTPSKITNPLITQHDIRRKRKASYKITDKNFVGAESNAVTKRLRLSADAAQAVAEKQLQRQSRVDSEDIDNNDSTSVNSSPKGLLEVADTPADTSDDVEMLNNHLVSDSEECEGGDKGEGTNPVETAEEERSESSIKHCKERSPGSPDYLIRTAISVLGVSDLRILPADAIYCDCRRTACP